MSDLIFLDTETTGLDPELHEVWEIAWAVNEGPITQSLVEHSIVTADMTALKMNGYFKRVKQAPIRYDVLIKEVLKGNTLVCANPTFDRMMLRKRWGLEPYHYRSIDVESMAMTVFEWARPLGLKDISQELGIRGYDIPEPDHSASKDVEVVREVYKALRDIQQSYCNAYNDRNAYSDVNPYKKATS